MSAITFLTTLVQQAITRLNLIETNAKKVDELPHQTTLEPTSKLPVSRAGNSEHLTIQQVIDAVGISNYNQLLAIGSITIDGTDIEVASGVSGQINGMLYGTSAITTISIALCETGFNRKDILVLTTNNEVIAISGEETDSSIVIAPPTPIDAVYITTFDVSDTAIGTPEDPIIGTSFVKKSFFAPFISAVTGANAIIPLDPNGYSEIRLTNASLTSIAGFDLSLITGVSTAEVPYNGKPYIIRNVTGNDITIKNELGAADFPFYLSGGSDLVFPDGQAIYVHYDASGFIEIFKSWGEVDLSTKVDKVSTAGVERAYIINADGSQGTNATSDFKAVVEGYFNGTNFYTDAGFTILITGETGIIYVDLDTTFTYRWTGSAYVQIGGGSELDIFNPYQNGYYVRGIYPVTGLTTFILSGINNTWSNIGTAEAYSTYEEFALIGSKSAATPGKSCGFTTTGSVRSLFYASQKNNALISSFIFRNSDASFVSDARFFVGYYSQGFSIGNVNPSTLTNCIGFGADSGDSNIQLIHNDVNGTATKIDLGVDFPANTSNVDTYRCEFFIDYPNNKAFAKITRLNTGNTTGTIEINSNIFIGASVGYDPWCWRNNGSTGLEVKIRIGNYLLAQKTR